MYKIEKYKIQNSLKGKHNSVTLLLILVDHVVLTVLSNLLLYGDVIYKF